ncbi:hypothetical protein [Hirschia maritima]|uniref:hypothetical protein n=1 Tax=Hirschia maritima TaxID=1121961 RepID=UPI00036FB703|nr:hypothetical protein [Hirschia maritima]
MKKIIFATISTLVWILPANAQVSESAEFSLKIEENENQPTEVLLTGFNDLQVSYNKDTEQFSVDEITWPMCMYSREDVFNLTVENTSAHSHSDQRHFAIEHENGIAYIPLVMDLYRRGPNGETLEEIGHLGHAIPVEVDIADAKQDETCSQYQNVHLKITSSTLRGKVLGFYQSPQDAGLTDADLDDLRFSSIFTLTMEPKL